MAATSPVSFYIGISSQRSKITFQQSSHENIETGEQLIVRSPPREYLDLVIARCPSTVDVQGWLQQMDRKAEEIEGQDIPKISVNGTQTGSAKCYLFNIMLCVGLGRGRKAWLFSNSDHQKCNSEEKKRKEMMMPGSWDQARKYG